jgi:osmotically-inducible protein OsmY
VTNDEHILKRVQAGLDTEPRINLHQFPIRLEVAAGVVYLEGEVENIAARRLALRVASETAGVKEVTDRLHILLSDPRGDGEILDALEQSLLRECDLRNCTLRRGQKGQVEILHEAVGDDTSGNILFSVADGVITLEGHVISLSHQRLAEVLAWWVPGCRQVVNRLRVVPAEEDHDHELNDAVRLVLELDPLVHADQIGVATNLGVVTLEGVVPRRDERSRAELDAWYVSGINEVINHIEVRP